MRDVLLLSIQILVQLSMKITIFDLEEHRYISSEPSGIDVSRNDFSHFQWESVKSDPQLILKYQ